MNLKIKQGEIYLVDFGKKYNSEIGKIRPAVVLQNNFLNRILPISRFQSVLVLPLSSQDIVSEYRMKIKARDRLKKDSFAVANWICTIDIDKILLDQGILAKLNEDELQELKQKVCNLM